MEARSARVDYGLLNRRSDQLLCSRCLKAGVRRRVVQIISARHQLQSLCPPCRESVSTAKPSASESH